MEKKYAEMSVQQIIMEVLNSKEGREKLRYGLWELAVDYQKLGKKHRPHSDYRDEFLYMSRHLANVCKRIEALPGVMGSLPLNKIIPDTCSKTELTEMVFYISAEILGLLDHETKNAWDERVISF